MNLLTALFKRDFNSNLKLAVERNEAIRNAAIRLQLLSGHPRNLGESNKVAIFVSIPKNASKEILHILDIGFNRDIDTIDPREHYIVHENHQRFSILCERYNASKLFSFAFVRNPFSRTYSWFVYHRSLGLPQYNYQNINDWVTDGMPTHFGKQNLTDWSAEGLSPLLQNNFLQGSSPIDFIGKVENFDHDMPLLINKLNSLFELNNINKRIKFKMPYVNKSKPKKTDKLTPESKQVIYEILQEDFIKFKYSK